MMLLLLFQDPKQKKRSLVGSQGQAVMKKKQFVTVRANWQRCDAMRVCECVIKNLIFFCRCYLQHGSAPGDSCSLSERRDEQDLSKTGSFVCCIERERQQAGTHARETLSSIPYSWRCTGSLFKHVYYVDAVACLPPR